MSEHTLFYCGDGWVDDESDSRQPEEIKQIDAVVKMQMKRVIRRHALLREKALGNGRG